MLDLNDLKAFLALAEELHFGRAARRLHITQPALSQQLKRLETRLAVRLIERTRRRSVLTDAGRSLMETATSLLADAERAEALLKKAAHGEKGVLRIAFTPSGAFGLLPDILKGFRRAFPEVSLEFYDGPLEAPVERLETGSVDVAFVRDPIPRLTLASHLIHSERMCAVVPATDSPASSKQISLKTLRDRDFVIFPRARAPHYFDAVIGLCRRAGFSPRVVSEAADWQVLASLVASGAGVTIAPLSVREIGRKGIKCIPITYTDRIAKLYLVRSNRTNSSLSEAFLRIARDSVVEASRARLSIKR